MKTIKCYGYFSVPFATIRSGLLAAHPELASAVLNIVPGAGVVKIDNHSGDFPPGAQDTLAAILEPYRKSAPIKIAMPLTNALRKDLNNLRLMKGWV